MNLMIYQKQEENNYEYANVNETSTKNAKESKLGGMSAGLTGLF